MRQMIKISDTPAKQISILNVGRPIVCRTDIFHPYLGIPVLELANVAIILKSVRILTSLSWVVEENVPAIFDMTG